jgi:tripartite-type tricarboxylate transporter receptor subunit TctC
MARLYCGIAALAFTIGPAVAQAQAYPSKPVRIIVPTSPGGGNDFVARLTGQKLGERLGQQFLVENRPGAGGAPATAQAARAAPDGYTLLLGFVGQLAMRPHVDNAGYDPRKDFAAIGSLPPASRCWPCIPPCLSAR